MTASEMLAMHGIACHMLGLAIVLPAGLPAREIIEGESSLEVTKFFFFGF